MEKTKVSYYVVASHNLNGDNSYKKGDKVEITGWNNTLESAQKNGYIIVNVGAYWNDDSPEKLRKLYFSEIHKVTQVINETDEVIYKNTPHKKSADEISELDDIEDDDIIWWFGGEDYEVWNTSLMF